MNILHKIQPAFSLIQLLVIAIAITGAVLLAAGQAGKSETVIQKATEEFENSPLTITSLGQGLYVFSGDGGNVTAIVDDGRTLLIDSGVASRITELSDAILNTTMRMKRRASGG